MPVKKPARPTEVRPRKVNSRKTIVWLASYPKSGNTWVRMFLANYFLGKGDTPVSINEAHRLGLGDSVSIAYYRANRGKYDPGDFTTHLALRDRVIGSVAGNGANINFMKTHNGNTVVQRTRLIDPAYTRAAIYIVRDPRDVAVSYARHYGQTLVDTCSLMSNPDHAIMADASSVTQYLGDWSVHVRDWVQARTFPVHSVRYEDLQADPTETFRAMLDFIGVPVDDDKLEKAVRFSSFEEVSTQEAKDGFIERSLRGEKFFHTGKSGQWKEQLTDEDAAIFQEKHGPMMRKFGYL